MRVLNKHFIAWVFAVVSVLVLLAGLGVLWVIKGPHSLPLLTEHIEKALNDINTRYKFTIRDTVLQWDGWEENVNFHIKSVTLDRSDGSHVANLPDVKFRLEIPKLFLGKLVFQEFIVSNPEVWITLPEPAQGAVDVPLNGSLSEEATAFPGAKIDKQAIIVSTLFAALDQVREFQKDIPIREVSLQNGKLVLRSGQQETLLDVEEANFELNGGTGTSFGMSMELRSPDWEGRSFISATIQQPNIRDDVLVDAEITNIRAQSLTLLFPRLYWLGNLDMRFSGKLSAHITPSKHIDSLTMNAVAQLEQDLAFGVNGEFKFYPVYKGEKGVPAGTIFIESKKLEVDKFANYWPPEIASDTRDWILKNLSRGVVEDLSANIAISPDEYLQGAISKETVNGKFKYSGLSVAYADDLPPFESVFGTSFFDGESITFNIAGGKLSSSEVSGILYIDGLSAIDQFMEMDMQSEGEANDLIPFLNLLHSKGNKKLGQAEGKSKVSYYSKFLLAKDLSWDKMMYKAVADISDVSLRLPSENIMHLSGGNFKLQADNIDKHIVGDGYINGVFVKAALHEKLKEDAAYDSSFDLSLYVTPDELNKLFAVELPEGIRGAASVSVQGESKGVKSNITVQANIKDTDIEFPLLDWKKSRGESGLFSFKGVLGNDVLNISNYKFASRDLSISGSGEIGLTEKYGTRLEVSELKLADKTDVQAQVIRTGKNSYKVSLLGKSLDAAPLLKYISSGSGSDKESVAVDAELSLSQLIMHNGEVVYDVEGIAVCEESKCDSISLGGKFSPQGENGFSLNLKPENDIRVFNLTSTNGGKILNSFDILRQVRGGDLIAGSSAPLKDPSAPFNGSLIMKNFKVVKAPVLAKLLTVASLSGIVNLLNGEGIEFDRLKGKYTYNNKILRLNEMKATGSSLAITIDGDVDFEKGELRLQGNLIPATLFNSIIENVPLLGYAVTAGGEEALVATRYTIIGSFTDPNVTVNPLSILTPGFLRNIWGDVTDDDNKEEPREKIQAPIDIK